MKNLRRNTFRPVLILISFLFFGQFVFAQKIGVNERGDSIVVFNDGSWRYFDASTDKDFLTPKKVSIQPEVEESEDLDSKPRPKTSSKKKNVNSGKKKKVKKSKKKKNKSNKKKKVKKSGKGKKYKDKKESIKYSDADEERFRLKAIQNAEAASQRVQMLLWKYEDMTYDRVLMEDELSDAYTSPNTTDSEIVAIEKSIQEQRDLENDAKSKYDIALAEATFLNKIIDVQEHKRRKLIAKWRQENPIAMENESSAPVLAAEDPSFQNSAVTETPLSKQTLKAQKDLRNMVDVYKNPPERECPERNQRFNEFTGKKVVSLKPELFFTKTPDQMRILLKDREYLTCNAFLSNTGGLTYLELEIIIASANADQSYGLVEKGSKMSMKMIDGYTISLAASRSVKGEVNNLEKTVTYKPRYFLDKSQLKTLSKAEIDQIRIVWMSGYEDYEIYDVDFLQHQINCLTGK